MLLYKKLLLMTFGTTYVIHFTVFYYQSNLHKTHTSLDR